MDLLLTDFVLPVSIDGSEIARAALQIQPNIKILFTTGYTESLIDLTTEIGTVMNIITKPYRRTGLLEKLQNILVDIED